MNKLSIYRVIDANGNRACEGLRMVEDICRFSLESTPLTAQYKHLRHTITKALIEMDSASRQLLHSRNTTDDIGVDRKAIKGEPKSSFYDLFRANCRRAEEALRVLEESSQLIEKSKLAGVFAACRYDLYTLESSTIPCFPRQAFQKVRLYLVTEESLSMGRSTLSVVQEAIKGGIDAVQLREPEMPLSRKIALGREIRKITRDSGTLFIVNDRPDLAMILDADGVHLGQDDLPVAEARKLMGSDILIGKSTHNWTQALEASKEDIDYLSVGPIYQTTSKKNAWAPVGIPLLSRVSARVKMPIVAIGGITVANLKNVLECGEVTIAVISAIVHSKNIRSSTRKLKQLIINA